jgi:GT2 family glycosyltransferase
MKFSIIVPVAPDRGAEVINSIKNLDFPKSQYEVIIERGTNPSRNRNIGAKKAKGEILCFLDDDAIVPRDLLKEAKRLFEWRLNDNFFSFIHVEDYPSNILDSRTIDILGGPQLTPPDDKWFAKACGEILASPFGSLSMADRYRKGKENFNADENSLTSCIMFVRADAYKMIGGFNESLFPGEDPEFLARAKKKGFRIAYSPNIYIWHRRRATLMGYIKQMFDYGKVRLEKEKKAKSEGKKGLLFYIPMLFSLYIMLIIFYSPTWLSYPLIAYLFLSFIFTCIALKDSAMANPKRLYSYLLLPCIFFITHFFYGLGMIEGLAKRWFK